MRRMCWCLITPVCGVRGIIRRRSSGDMHAVTNVFATPIAQQNINSTYPPVFYSAIIISFIFFNLSPLVCSKGMLSRLSSRSCLLSSRSIRTIRCFSESSCWKDFLLIYSSPGCENHQRGRRHPVYWCWCQSRTNFTCFIEICNSD